ncbi:MAG: hypothetical protein RL839_04740 [Gammaproteobacteria bacterium]
MIENQFTKGRLKRVMYIENKDGDIEGSRARVGWVTFSKTGRSVFYRGKELNRIKGGGVAGNYLDPETGHEYWVSGIKKRGSNTHWAESTKVSIDPDALNEYESIIGNRDT